MKREEKFLVRCLRGFLSGEQNLYPRQEDFPWDQFLKLARIHGVGGMVYLAVRDSERVPGKIKNDLKHQFDFAVACAIRRDLLMSEVESALCRSEIKHIYFKGYEICRYYPVPEVRMMSDVDILIRKEDCERVEKAMGDAGYIQQNKGYKGYVYYKDSLVLEIHTAFGGEPENGADFSGWIGGGFEYGRFDGDGYTGFFQPSYHFVYLVYHAAKHFNSAGAGIRMFLDLAVFWNRYKDELDGQEINRNLCQMKLDVFAGMAFWLCNHWFGTEIPWEQEPEEDLREIIAEYMFSGGIYGHHKRSISHVYLRRAVNEQNEGSRKRQKLRVMIQYFFPGRKQMEGFLPSVKKYPFLLPAAWIIRAYQGLFLRKNHSINVIRGIEKGSADAEKEFRMLKRLGLWK